jgi:hypothetical protein
MTFRFRCALLGLVLAAFLVSALSCGRDQQLVSIEIQPGVETVGATNIPVALDAGPIVQLRALGTYIHPPVTKDITDQVTWVSNTTGMFTVSATGFLTATGDSCGGTLVSATATTNTSAGGISSSGAIVTGYMTANVVCYTGTGGGTGNPLLSITFLGSGLGTVADSALNFSCSSPGPCSTQAFTSGTLITLTATPSGSSTFAGWPACPTSTTNNVCAFTLSGNQVVTATFN